MTLKWSFQTLTLALSLSSCSQAQTGTATIWLDNKLVGQASFYTKDHQLMLPLVITARLGWQPVFDEIHKVIDLGGCARINLNSSVVQAINGQNLDVVSVANQVATLPTAPEYHINQLALPLLATAQAMGYGAIFDGRAKKVLLTSPVISSSTAPWVEHCAGQISLNRKHK